MSQQYEKQETSSFTSTFLLPVSAVIIAILSIAIVPISAIIFTGILFGGNQSVEVKSISKKKNAGIVVISYSQPLEDLIKKSNLDTPELPLQTHYSNPYSLRSFNYRY